MAREGIGTILACALVAAVLSVGWVVSGTPALALLAILLWVGVGVVVYFFRDPKRIPPQGKGLLLSPADGRVVAIERQEAREFLSGPIWRIAIFLSLFDVHVVRAPLGGRVSYFRYQKGRFTPAGRRDAGRCNEQVLMGISAEEGEVLVQLIAGAVARRVVCYPREGWQVERGQKIGIIKFGSRVELVLPATATLQVQLGQKVRGGETIIASFGL